MEVRKHNNLASTVIIRMVKELSGLGYFYESTAKQCCDYVLHQMGEVATQEVKEHCVKSSLDILRAHMENQNDK